MLKRAARRADALGEQFEAIETRTDAALFIVEAKLQIRYDIDFKRDRRPGPDRLVPQRRHT
jgi:hypothetical protein